MPIRLILADDHPIVLDGLKRLFESQPDFEVVCCCTNGDAALEAARTQSGDVLVLDLRMPGRTGLDVLRAVGTETLGWRTIILTAAVRDDELVEMTQLGLRGLALKESAPETLIECVRRVHLGEQWMDPTLAGAFGRVMRRDAATREVAGTLTPREIEIVKMTAQGLRNKAIAVRLGISEGTVKIHLHHIYEKFKVDGRLELVLYAQEKGFV